MYSFLVRAGLQKYCQQQQLIGTSVYEMHLLILWHSKRQGREIVSVHNKWFRIYKEESVASREYGAGTIESNFSQEISPIRSHSSRLPLDDDASIAPPGAKNAARQPHALMELARGSGGWWLCEKRMGVVYPHIQGVFTSVRAPFQKVNALKYSVYSIKTQ